MKLSASEINSMSIQSIYNGRNYHRRYCWWREMKRDVESMYRRDEASRRSANSLSCEKKRNRERRGEGKRERKEERERIVLARATIPDGRTKGRQRGWLEGLEGCLGRDAVGVSQDWLFANVKLTSTLPPTHVVRTFAPRVLRLKVIPVSLASSVRSVTTREFFFRNKDSTRCNSEQTISAASISSWEDIQSQRERER